MIENVEEAVKEFLKHDRNEMLVIKGPWGSGKTYAWKQWVKEYKNLNIHPQRPIAYVSLFGCQSIDDLKSKIVEALPIDFERNNSNFLNQCQKGIKWLDNVSESLENKGVLGVVTKTVSAFLPSPWSLINSAVICFDDYERKHSSISASDFFGVLTELKDEKECKIVLLLNENALNSDEVLWLEYIKNREKVIDRELNFISSSMDKLNIALNSYKSKNAIKDYTGELQHEQRNYDIQNIRILFKILSHLDEIITTIFSVSKSREKQSEESNLIVKEIINYLFKLVTLQYATPSGVISLTEYRQFRDLKQKSLRPALIDNIEFARKINTFEEYGYIEKKNYLLSDFYLTIEDFVSNGYINRELFAHHYSERVKQVKDQFIIDEFQEESRKIRIIKQSFPFTFSDLSDQVNVCIKILMKIGKVDENHRLNLITLLSELYQFHTPDLAEQAVDTYLKNINENNNQFIVPILGANKVNDYEKRVCEKILKIYHDNKLKIAINEKNTKDPLRLLEYAIEEIKMGDQNNIYPFILLSLFSEVELANLIKNIDSKYFDFLQNYTNENRYPIHYIERVSLAAKLTATFNMIRVNNPKLR